MSNPFSSNGEKTPRPVVVIAALGLVSVALVAVAAMAYDVVVNKKDAGTLATIASMAVGALAGLAAGHALAKSGEPENK